MTESDLTGIGSQTAARIDSSGAIACMDDLECTGFVDGGGQQRHDGELHLETRERTAPGTHPRPSHRDDAQLRIIGRLPQGGVQESRTLRKDGDRLPSPSGEALRFSWRNSEPGQDEQARRLATVVHGT